MIENKNDIKSEKPQFPRLPGGQPGEWMSVNR